MSSSPRLTARRRLVTALSEEILSRSEDSAFLLSSEHALCRRFNISRVTVRLALSDLETKGLIYRKQGKGTFAHGRSSRNTKGIAILIKSENPMECWPLAEIARGMQSHLQPQKSPVTILSLSPREWAPELTSMLAGVVIFPEGVSVDELEILKNRKLPYLFASKTDLPGPRLVLGQCEAARLMTEKLLSLGHQRLALLTGFHPSLDAIKREGVRQALIAQGPGSALMTEVAVSSGEEASLAAIRAVLQQRDCPTGWIALDDGFAAMLIFCARREGLKVPDDISIVSFHDLPFFRYLEPALTTVRFEFFAAGQRAAENLHRAFLADEEMQDIVFQPEYRPGQSVARYRSIQNLPTSDQGQG